MLLREHRLHRLPEREAARLRARACLSSLPFPHPLPPFNLPLEIGEPGRVTEPFGERVAVDLQLGDLKRRKQREREKEMAEESGRCEARSRGSWKGDRGGRGYVTEGQRRVSGNAARLGSFHRSTESTARKIREERWKNAVYSRGVRVNLLAAARAHSAHRWLRSNSPTRRIGSHRRRQRQRGRDPSLFGEVNGRTREKRRRMEGGRRKKKKGEEREREWMSSGWSNYPTVSRSGAARAAW